MWNDDKEACTREVLSILKYVDFLKLSDEEIDMVGGHDNVLNIMKEYDIAAAVLTLGGGGAELFYDGQSYVVPGYRVDHVGRYHGSGRRILGRLPGLRAESGSVLCGSAECGYSEIRSEVRQCKRFSVCP